MISLKKLLLFPCLLFICCLNGQSALKVKIDSILKIESITDKTSEFQKLLQSQDTSQQTEDIGTLFQELATCYYRQKDYEKAIPLYKNAVEIQSKYKDKEAYNNSRYNLTRIYAKIGEKEAEHKLLINIVNDEGNDRFTSYAYRYLSRNARDNGDISQALYYLNSGLANKALCENLKIKNALLNDIITVYADKYKTNLTVDPKDLEIVEKQQKLILFDSLTLKNQSVLNNSLAIIYDGFKDLDRALYFYKKAAEGFVKIKNLPAELDVISNIGIIYSKKGKYDLAEAAYKRVLKESDDKEQIATVLVSMGYYLNSSVAKEKIPYFEKAINTILEKDTTQAFQIPTLTEIKESEYYEQDILIYLIDLVAHYVQAYHQEKSLEYLHQGKDAVKVIDQLVSLIRYEIDTEDSKLFWIRKGVNIYMLGVEIAYLLEDAASGFYYMEKNKALLLQENIKTLQAKLALNVPKDLIAREHQLNYEIQSLQEQLLLDAENDSLKTRFTQINTANRQFLDSMQTTYPDYIQIKQEVAIATLENTIKAFPNKDDCFVEYILSETNGFGIYYDNGTPEFFEFSNTPMLQTQLQRIQELNINPFLTDEELKEYKEIGYELFTTLFPFENASERLKNKKLTIVADQALLYIPFEALPVSITEELSKSYLVYHTETFYLQSFSLFKQIQKRQNKPTQKILSIAPQTFTDSTLIHLKGEKILNFISNSEKSIVLTQQNASKENFLQRQNNFEIIHFNTHAGLDANTKQPWIAFHDEKMTLHELLGIENQADLVILDACQTNNGINRSGEGVMNLSRGFFYNGTQSVMASLWNVNEQAGNKILQTFYNELFQGTSKSKSLQLAKIKYLEEHQFSQNEPYFWAAFTFTGTTNSIQIQTKPYTTYIITGIVLVVFFILAYVYKKRATK